MIAPQLYDRFSAFRQRLGGVRSVVLTTHINPDGDGLGSQLALAEHLSAKGAAVSVLNNDAVPPPYRFLDPEGSLLRRYDRATDADRIAAADMIIVVDTNHPDRLGSMSAAVRDSSAFKVVIDHHLEPDGFADLAVADENACATGEIVYRLLEDGDGLPLSRRAASALYTAIMTDTGSFRFPKTDADVHRITAALIDMGAEPSRVYEQVYERGSAGRLRLMGEALSTMELSHDGSVCTMYVTKQMFERTGTSEIDTEKFVTYPMSIEGVRVSVLVSELPGGLKLNVRTKGLLAANELAKVFGGNGHLNAAGARVSSGSVPEILARVRDAATTILKGHMPA